MPDFEALEIAGSKEYLRGFVRGWAAATGIQPTDLARRVLWAEDWDVRLGERGWLSFLQGRVQGLLVRADTVDPLLTAIQSHGTGLDLHFRRHVDSARFEFEFEIFGRKEADEIRALFGSCAPAVTLVDYHIEEKSDPDAVGLELRGSLHDYVFRGSGTATGGPGAVLALHERTHQHERIRAHEITLELAP